MRTAAPGTTFTLADHPEHDRDGLEQIGRMSILIDGGGNGYNERLQYAAFIQRYLGDGMETVQTGTITATRQRINHGQWTTTGNAFTLNVNYTPQRPSGVENETTFFSGGAAYPL